MAKVILVLSVYIMYNFQVFVGRPVLWGLALGGQAGVERMIDIFRTELEYTFQIAGILNILYLHIFFGYLAKLDFIFLHSFL